jgi:hypothetical protein
MNTILCLFLSGILLFNANSSWSQADSGLMNVHGSVKAKILDTTYPVYLAKILFISNGDTITTYSYNSNYSIRLPRLLPSGVAQGSASKPELFTLSQNYPNPFNPTTVITYQLSEEKEINLTVYSITGQAVKLLDSGYKSSGSHTVVWNGCDNQGRKSGAGIYFYQLRAGDKCETRKMLLLDSGGIPNSGSALSKPSAKSEKTVETGVAYKIVIVRDGYETYSEDGFNLPESGDQIQKNFVLERKPVPGEYFPFVEGNHWECLSAKGVRENTFADVPDSLITVTETAVIGTRTLEGNKYSVFDKWPIFIPEIFHNENVTPLVRVSEQGELILRYRDTEILLFSLPPLEISRSVDLGVLFHNSQEDSAWFKDTRMDILMNQYEYDMPCTTPAGTYHDCRTVHISTHGRITTNYYFYFSRTAGLVCCLKDDGQEYIFLKRGTIDMINYGVIPGVCEADTVTDTDLLEILRLALDPALRDYTEGSGYPYTSGEPIVSSADARILSLIPLIPSIVYAPLEKSRVDEIVKSGVLFSFLSLYAHGPNQTGIVFENGEVIVPVGTEFAGQGTVGYSIGTFHEFTRKQGMWAGKHNGWWIAE